MPTKAELKQKTIHVKPKFRIGDRVMIIAGKDKGQIGFIASFSPEEQKAMILQENPENQDMPIPLNAVVKHHKAKVQGDKSRRQRQPAPIHMSNIMILDAKTGKPTRVGRKLEGGKLIRYGKKSGQQLEDAPYKSPE